MSEQEFDEHLAVQAKAELRKQVRRIRKTIPRASRDERSRRIVTRLTEFDALDPARCIAVFQPMREEVDIGELRTMLHQRGTRVALPRVDEELGIVMHEVARDTALVETRFGVQEPSPDLPVADDIDVVIVPALAFDPRGYRIGYGRGYYDRYLSENPRALRVGVAFDFQLLVDLPRAKHDVPVHFIVTDKRLIECIDGP